MNECLKQINGVCKGCDLFNHGIALIRSDVPYQEVITEVWRACPPGTNPDLNPKFNQNGLESLIIENEIIK